jgi:hypothetical protein
VDLLDSPRELPQAVGVRRSGELVEVLSLTAKKADVKSLSTEIESRVQHVERASLVLGW